MVHPPHYNFLDVLWAPARAFSARKIAVMTVFLLMALTVYDALTYIAFLIDGGSIGFAWRAYGLLPLGWMSFDSKMAEVVYWIGIALAAVTVMQGMLSVGLFRIEEVRGNRLLSARQAIRHSFKRWGQLFGGELAMLLFIAFIAVGLAVVGLITRIPVVGEWFYSLFFLLPNFVVSFGAVFVGAVFFISILLLPATAAAERNGETFRAMLETYSTVIRQPARWLGYTAYSLAAAKLFSFVYAYFAFRAIQFSVWAASIGGGDKPEQLVRAGLAHLPVKSDIAQHIVSLYPGSEIAISLTEYAWSPTEDPASYLMAFMLFVIVLTVVGYALAVVATAQASGYIALRRIKDNHDIAAEASLFLKDEWVNPPLDETESSEPK